MESWLVSLQQHHAGYISWDGYLENQRMLERNQTNGPEQVAGSAAREGRALLQGLLLCAHCGRRLSPKRSRSGGEGVSLERRLDRPIYCAVGRSRGQRSGPYR